MMNRRDVLKITALVAAGVEGGFAACADVARPASRPIDVPFEMVSVAQLSAAIASGAATAASLLTAFADRVAAIDRGGPALNSVIEMNPDSGAIARRVDEERRAGKARGPMHGLPVMVKDNLDTGDRMMTTAGSLALVGSVAARDSTVVRKLREAGAVLMGKTNLSEWANFRGARSTSGWSGRGGLTRNPYALDRNPSGSSSGSAVAVAAGLCAAAIGTETNGSIVSPAAVCGVVGLKPTVGLVSRAGIIPISSSQDTAGPIGRCVADVAAVLTAIAGADERDPATAGARVEKDYAALLQADGLKKARIGVARAYFLAAGAVTEKVYEASLEAMRAAGAVLIEVPAVGNVALVGAASMEVMLYEFKAGLNAYLAGLDAGVKVRSLADVIAFNEANAEKELRWFGQEILVRAEAKGPLTEAAYVEALARCRRFARAEGIDAVMDELKLDALVAPSGGPAGVTDLVYGDRGVGGSSGPAAVAGYPNVTVPAGEVRGLPVGLSFFGRAWSEGVLLRLAYAFERATMARRVPTYAATVGG